MFASVILALALTHPAATPPPCSTPGPAGEWRPFSANPAFEVYGHEEGGVFRYTASRPKAKTVVAVVNYGVKLSPAASIGAPVSGTDREAGRALQEATAKAEAMGLGDAGDGPGTAEAAGDCPDGRRCPRPPPEPPATFPHPFKDIASLPTIGWMVVGSVLIGFAFVVVCLLVLALVVYCRR